MIDGRMIFKNFGSGYLSRYRNESVKLSLLGRTIVGTVVKPELREERP